MPPGSLGQRVADALEVAAAVDATHVSIELRRIEGVTRLGAHRAAHRFGVDTLGALDLDRRDAQIAGSSDERGARRRLAA